MRYTIPRIQDTRYKIQAASCPLPLVRYRYRSRDNESEEAKRFQGRTRPERCLGSAIGRDREKSRERVREGERQRAIMQR